MAIEVRTGSDGKARYRVRVARQNPVTGKRENVTVGTYRLKRDAERAERKALDELERGTFVAPKDRKPPEPPATVADVVQTWFDLKKREVTVNSAAGYEVAIRKHLIPVLGHRPVEDLTHDEIQNLVNGWQDEGKGAQVISRCMLILRSALARQVRQGKLWFNPASDIVKPSPKTRRDIAVWTPEQMRSFLAKAEADPLGPFWWLTLLEGMRRGEALGLRWKDIQWSDDESSAVAFIRQTVVSDLSNGGRALVQPRAKTRSSERVVELNPVTAQALRAHRDRQMLRRQQVREVWQDHGLVIPNALGEPLNPSTVKGNRERLMQAAGVPRLTTHDLRHLAATVMLASGTSLALVSRKIGHSSVATTADIYGHAVMGDQAAPNAAMSEYLGRRPTGTDARGK